MADKGNLAQDTEFDIEKTIQSQYASSPRMSALVAAIGAGLDPSDDIDLFYGNAFNPKTAVGYGLDCWGRIVGANRLLTGVDAGDDYFGFIPIGDNDRITPFDEAPFYTKTLSNSFILEDEAYRLLIFTKAMANISTLTLPSMNYIFAQMLDGIDVAVLHDSTMHLRIVINDSELQDFQRTLLKRDDMGIIPAGVGWSLYELDPDSFGFDGSGLESFNNGVFTGLAAMVECGTDNEE